MAAPAEAILAGGFLPAIRGAVARGGRRGPQGEAVRVADVHDGRRNHRVPPLYVPERAPGCPRRGGISRVGTVHPGCHAGARPNGAWDVAGRGRRRRCRPRPIAGPCPTTRARCRPASCSTAPIRRTLAPSSTGSTWNWRRSCSVRATTVGPTADGVGSLWAERGHRSRRCASVASAPTPSAGWGCPEPGRPTLSSELADWCARGPDGADLCRVRAVSVDTLDLCRRRRVRGAGARGDAVHRRRLPPGDVRCRACRSTTPVARSRSPSVSTPTCSPDRQAPRRPAACGRP